MMHPKILNGNSISKDEKELLDNYIVRIYRRDERNSRIMGFVEETRNAYKKTIPYRPGDARSD